MNDANSVGELAPRHPKPTCSCCLVHCPIDGEDRQLRFRLQVKDIVQEKRATEAPKMKVKEPAKVSKELFKPTILKEMEAPVRQMNVKEL